LWALPWCCNDYAHPVAGLVRSRCVLAGSLGDVWHDWHTGILIQIQHFLTAFIHNHLHLTTSHKHVHCPCKLANDHVYSRKLSPRVTISLRIILQCYSAISMDCRHKTMHTLYAQPRFLHHCHSIFTTGLHLSPAPLSSSLPSYIFRFCMMTYTTSSRHITGKHTIQSQGRVSNHCVEQVCEYTSPIHTQWVITISYLICCCIANVACMLHS
jgi:hypothetical protein